MASSRTVLDLKDSSRTKSRGLGLGLGFEHSVLEQNNAALGAGNHAAAVDRELTFSAAQT